MVSPAAGGAFTQPVQTPSRPATKPARAHLEVVLDEVELGLERLEAPLHLQLVAQKLPNLACSRQMKAGVLF